MSDEDTTANIISDEERCWHGRFFGEWCKERGYPLKVRLGDPTGNWLWCGKHGPAVRS